MMSGHVLYSSLYLLALLILLTPPTNTLLLLMHLGYINNSLMITLNHAQLNCNYCLPNPTGTIEHIKCQDHS